MKPEIAELIALEKEVARVWSELTNAHSALTKLEPVLGKVKVKQLLKEIKPVQKKNQKELQKVRDKINKFQKECKHGQWIWLGRDSHHDHEECGICGYVDYRA